MRFSMRPVQKHEKEILRNLLEKYNYEFSQYTREDVNALGLYDYNWLDCYWTEPARFAFFLYAGDALAGFAMVNDYDENGLGTRWSMAEFFVVYKYRRQGLGRWAANALFTRFPGSWQLMCHPHNEVSCRFWEEVVRLRTGGNFRLLSPAASMYPDGTPGNVFVFSV